MNAVEVDFSVEGHGRPVYMAHGIGARQGGWDAMARGLTAHFTCVSYDLRGHGQSPAPPAPYSLAQLVADLEALRRRLGHDKIHLIGHSLGGMIGPAYARAHPSRVLSLGLLSTAAARSASDHDQLRRLDESMARHGVASAVDSFITRWFTDEFIKAHPQVVEQRIQQVLDTPEEVFRSVFQIYARTEMAPWLHEITCPCLLLTGALDSGCSPRLNAFMAAELPHAELVILDNLKHAILLEAPARVLAAVKPFLMKQGG